MPSTYDHPFDAHRFPRTIDLDPMTIRPKNVAKVEPYSISNDAHRSAYPSPSGPINTNDSLNNSTKARIIPNSMENTSTSSSAASLAGMIRRPNALQSDFLVPNPAYFLSQSPSRSELMPSLHSSEPFTYGSLYPSAGSARSLRDEHQPGFLSSNRILNGKYRFFDEVKPRLDRVRLPERFHQAPSSLRLSYE
jgi:hypothetical protein